MENSVSEIDDKSFFLSDDGDTDAKSELDATLHALLNETRLDDNSTACRFPARKAWLQEKLNITDFVKVQCREYDNVLKRLNPKSATLVFPSAHINSPASMFGHTFLRINSAYKSRLLSYAINYAADANPDKENAVLFALKGLFGGYYGKYSLLPYYDKLKEYRDTEQRDIWEYNLDLNEEEVLKMFRHIWELNGTHSNYYFFTQNCSYNMLWFIEIARPSINLRKYFHFEVIPLETVHASKLEGIISSDNYRPSKRTILLKYELLIESDYLHIPRELVDSKIKVEEIVHKKSIPTQQKKYILEAAIEFLEYSFSKNDMDKKLYLRLFHTITKARASLGRGKKLDIKSPQNPIESHRAIRLTSGLGHREGKTIGLLGIRPAYHDLEDSSYGFLRGTQIEFLDLLLSYSDKKTELENATIISIISLAQRSEFFDSFSWRTKFGWDKEYVNKEINFITTVGAGYSFGNELAYTYFMVDPLFYIEDKFISAVGGSIGVVLDKYKFTSTNFEATRRWYDNGDKQNLLKVTQRFRFSQNLQLKLKYNYNDDEQTYRAMINFYF